MRARSLVVATTGIIAGLASAGCGDVGLDQFDTAAESVTGAMLDIQPKGDVWFGEQSPEAPSAFQEIVLKSAGDAQVAVIDVYLDEMTSQAFQMASDDLPLPIRLPPGNEFPVNVSFSPYAVGEFTGTFVVEVDDNGEIAQQKRTLKGAGCPPDLPSCN